MNLLRDYVGLYCGEALVANSQGKGYMNIYNVTERDHTGNGKTFAPDGLLFY